MTVLLLKSALLGAVIVAVGCEEAGPLVLVDAPTEVDARRRGDGSVVDGPCGAEARFVARLVDFDFTDAMPTAVENAIFAIQSQPQRIAVSDATGLVDMCAPVDAGDLQKLEVDAPGDYLDGVVFAARYISPPTFPTTLLRTITRTRADAFYSALTGVAFDGAKAHVIVLNACDGVEAILDRPHGTTLRAREQLGHALEWSIGAEANYVLFPNVDVSQPTGVVSWAWFGQTRVVPLRAGQWTMLVDCVAIPI